ncbi:hypothetical protein DFJ77DRAFT_445797 [Powellomyces hirtus]|nr:hypothetical protein DFJ77DRAFT_445797 [Powellomyces hirtus]
MDFLQAFNDQPNAKGAEGDRALPFKLPAFVVSAIDQYLDGMKPELAPMISREIGSFQESTLGDLEAKVHLVFDQIFHGDFSAFHTTSSTVPTSTPQQNAQAGGYGYGAQQPVSNGGYSLDAPQQQQQQTQTAPTGGYGYANQQAVNNGGYALNETQARELGGDDITSRDLARDFDERVVGPTDRGIISDAMSAVKNFASETSENISSALDPREKAKQLIPPLREKVSLLLTEKHRGLSESFTNQAIDQLKIYLHGNISPRELGSAGVDNAVDMLSGLFGGDNNKENQDRALPNMGGITNLFSQKLAQGLAVIKVNLHQSLHRDLTAIESSVFSDLPDHIRGPLEFVFGGNPFASGQPGERGLVSDLSDKIKSIIRGIQEGLQEKARGLVVDGHRILETKAIDRAQEVVVGRVRRYLPNAQF